MTRIATIHTTTTTTSRAAKQQLLLDELTSKPTKTIHFNKQTTTLKSLLHPGANNFNMIVEFHPYALFLAWTKQKLHFYWIKVQKNRLPRYQYNHHPPHSIIAYYDSSIDINKRRTE